MEREIERLLYKAGVLRTYVGYNYFVEAVRLVSADPTRHLRTCKEIYIPIAQEYDADPRTVERNLRTVRDVFMKNNGKEILHGMGYEVWCDKPGVRELIEIFAAYLRGTGQANALIKPGNTYPSTIQTLELRKNYAYF